MRTVNEHFASDSARDTLGHWILLGDYEAEAFVNWLMNDSGLSNYEIIDELEYQINKPDASFQTIHECSKALDTIIVSCAICGRTISFGEEYTTFFLNPPCPGPTICRYRPSCNILNASLL